MTTLKNKKGVSLVELIAVIVIMGIIATVGGISVAQIISNSNKSAAASAVSDVYSAAKNYFQSNASVDGATVDSDALVTAGYLEQATSNKFSGDTLKITATYTASTATVTLKQGTGDSNVIKSGDYIVTLEDGVWKVKG